MKPFRIFGFYALPVILLAALLALFTGLGARLKSGTPSVGALSLPETLPAGIMVQPGAILGGQALRIGEAIANGTNPATSGLQRPVGSFVYTRDGTTSYIKTGTAATAWTPSGGGGGTQQAGAIDRARLLTGMSAALMTCYREDWGPTWSQQYVDALVGSGGIVTNSVPASDVGGLLALNTGPTAGSRARRHVGAMLFPRADTGKLYMATRAAVTTAIDAQTIAIVGSFDFAGTFVIGMGVCGVTSTANFVANFDAGGGSCAGTKIVTGTARDTAQHEFEQWTTGDGRVHFAIDLNEIGSSPFVMASPPTNSSRPMFDVQNQTSAVQRTLVLDWYLACWEQT